MQKQWYATFFKKKQKKTRKCFVSSEKCRTFALAKRKGHQQSETNVMQNINEVR